MKTILERIKAGEILVGDGAMGSMLFQRGLQRGDCPEKMNLDHPEVIEEIARFYLEAGADIIQTNTFGGTVLRLKEYGLEGEADEINKRAVEAVRKVVGDKAYISGSCGPSGKMLLPYGDAEPELLYEAFERQTRVLIEAGVDIICFETMTDLREAAIAIESVKALSKDTPVMTTMTFDKIPRGYFTVMGTNISSAAEGLKEVGADIIGSNCGNGIENMIEIAREFRNVSDLPIIIQSNAGLPEVREGHLIYPETPEFFAHHLAAMKSVGVSIIGGCCGTTPNHIRAIRRIVDTWK
ncbi:MAG: homocysteine S-methyltransferase family protein [Bacteroidetes bacterium]|nr:homocysteine S-methyltransferase family protein [Bacteroidota bacterium]